MISKTTATNIYAHQARGNPFSLAQGVFGGTYRFLYLPFFIGLVASQKINVVGELFAGELLSLLFIIFSIHQLRLTNIEKKIIFFALLWTSAQLLSDFVNNSVLSDSLKGVVAPLMFTTSIVGLGLYLRNNISRMPSFLLGSAIGGLINLLYQPSDFFLYNPWKWGLGSAVLTIFIVYFSFFLRLKSVLILFAVLFSFFLVSLFFNARSMAIFPLLAASGYVYFRGGRGKKFLKLFSGQWGVIRLFFAIVPVLYLLNAGASALFSSDLILSRVSPEAAAKYRKQATSEYGIVLGGRSEIFISMQAFMDKPLLGHGSWAKDKGSYRRNYISQQSDNGESVGKFQYAVNISDLIPSHSYLMGALVWSGILGGLFWISLLNSMLRIFIHSMNSLPLYFYNGMFGFVWNVFFSPFGADSRWSSAIFIAAFLSYTFTFEAMKRVK
ncbi:MAG: hypothetical protein PHG00_04410 [Methylococcales bacterium]|nr:hypothetical protein [Methylococcales bacterium]